MTVVSRSAEQRGRLRHNVNVVAFIQLSFEIWQSDHTGKVLPDIRCTQSECLSDCCRSADLRSWYLAILCEENAFALKGVEVFGE